MSVISRKNQVTLPVEALRAAGLQPGDDLCVLAVAPGRLELVRADELIGEFSGCSTRRSIPTGIWTTCVASGRSRLRRGCPDRVSRRDDAGSGSTGSVSAGANEAQA